MKIQIYASTYGDAAAFAATMNLALRHWEHAGMAQFDTWADVGAVMDEIEESE